MCVIVPPICYTCRQRLSIIYRFMMTTRTDTRDKMAKYTRFFIGESLMSIKREYSKWELNEWRKKCFYRINDIYWWALWYSGYPLLPLLVWTHHLHAIKRQFPSIEYFTVVSNGKFYAQQLLIIKNDGQKIRVDWVQRISHSVISNDVSIGKRIHRLFRQR